MYPYTILKLPDIEYLADEHLKATKWYTVTGDASEMQTSNSGLQISFQVEHLIGFHD